MFCAGIDKIDPRHPALPGHFPGDPVVPGVVILTRVVNAAAKAFGAGVVDVTLAKFHVRLKPAEEFRIELERTGEDAVRFRVQRAETMIASGILRLHSASQPRSEPPR